MCISCWHPNGLTADFRTKISLVFFPKKKIRPDRGHPLHHNFQFWFWQFDLMGFWGCYTQHAKTRQRPSCVVKLIKDTLDGSEIPNNHLGCIKSPK